MPRTKYKSGKGSKTRVSFQSRGGGSAKGQRAQRVANELMDLLPETAHIGEAWTCAVHMVTQGDATRSPKCPVCSERKPQDLPCCLKCQVESYAEAKEEERARNE